LFRGIFYEHPKRRGEEMNNLEKITQTAILLVVGGFTFYQIYKEYKELKELERDKYGDRLREMSVL